MSSLIIGTSEVMSNATFTVEMSYSAGSGMKAFTIQDDAKIYFDNNTCKKAGVYSITAYMNASGATGTPAMSRAGVSPTVSVSLGWDGIVYPSCACTVVRKLNVGDTVTAWVDGTGATFSKAYCIVTKII